MALAVPHRRVGGELMARQKRTKSDWWLEYEPLYLELGKLSVKDAATTYQVTLISIAKEAL